MERDPSIPFSRIARDDLIQNGDGGGDGDDDDDDKTAGQLITGETEYERTMRKRGRFRMGVAGETNLTGRRDVMYRSLNAWDHNRVDPLVVHPSHVEEWEARKFALSEVDEMVAAVRSGSGGSGGGSGGGGGGGERKISTASSASASVSASSSASSSASASTTPISTSRLRRGSITLLAHPSDSDSILSTAPKLSRTMIRELMLVTAAASMDKSLEPFHTVQNILFFQSNFSP